MKTTAADIVLAYRHEIPWTNRLILGDGLQVMASLWPPDAIAPSVGLFRHDRRNIHSGRIVVLAIGRPQQFIQRVAWRLARRAFPREPGSGLQ